MIYLDHHATTPLAEEALQAMLPIYREHFANAGSITHAAGRAVGEMVVEAIGEIAGMIGSEGDEIVVTSGATESNNLALLGTCLHPRQKRRKIVSLQTEHKAILDPLERLRKQGFEVVLLPVLSQDAEPDCVGRVDLQQIREAVDDETALVSVMLANNEIGTVQPLAEIAAICHEHETLLHSDATQAVGRIPCDVDGLGVDLMSFSAHKFYGPKGVGGLYVRRRERRVRLQAQIVGGGQQANLRSGTLNTVGIIGMCAALRTCLQSLEAESQRIALLRQRLFDGLKSELDFMKLNGPTWTPADAGLPASEHCGRLSGNLNCCFFPVEGQSLMLETPELAVSSGSACTSASPGPSHVLMSLGLSEDQARSSLRFGIGRTNTELEIDQAAEWIIEAARRLRNLI